MTNKDLIYPWWETLWQHTLQRYQAGQLPHALLLAGPQGLGKMEFAQRLTQSLLCDHNKPAGASQAIVSPCGQCNGCHLLAAGSHPDFRLLVPESEGKQIPVDAIREVSRFFTLKPQFAPLQVVIIAPAEAMNKYAANSLLKTLEEPTPDSLIMLVASQPNRLLPTIRSRCQTLEFPLPDPNLALSWLKAQPDVQDEDTRRLLQIAGGAPLLAARYAHQGTLAAYRQLLASFEKLSQKQADPVVEAKHWEAAGFAQSLKWLYLWVSSLIRLKSDPMQADNIAEWREPVLDTLVQKLNNKQLYRYLDKVVETTRVVNSQANVQLALEDLLISWFQLHNLQT